MYSPKTIHPEQTGAALRRLAGYFLLVAAVMWLTSCATASRNLQITGESIVGLGTQFDVVSRHMTAACVAKTYTVQTCTNYRTFGEKFKQAYPAAKSLWNAAIQFEDKGLSASAADALTKLTSDLAPYVAMMGGK